MYNLFSVSGRSPAASNNAFESTFCDAILDEKYFVIWQTYAVSTVIQNAYYN